MKPKRYVCDHCGVEFVGIRHRKHHYCSRGCYVAAPGLPNSQETRDKMCAAHEGKNLSPAHCAAIARGKTGRKRPGLSARMSSDKNPSKNPASRARLSVAMTGDKHPMWGKHPSDETCARISVSKMGARNPSWRGGISDERNRAQSRSEYSEWRKAVFERDDYTCQVCRRRGGYLEAHHIIWWSRCRALFYDISNGLTACKTPCHMKVLHAPSMQLAG